MIMSLHVFSSHVPFYLSHCNSLAYLLFSTNLHHAIHYEAHETKVFSDSSSRPQNITTSQRQWLNDTELNTTSISWFKCSSWTKISTRGITNTRCLSSLLSPIYSDQSFVNTVTRFRSCKKGSIFILFFFFFFCVVKITLQFDLFSDSDAVVVTCSFMKQFTYTFLIATISPSRRMFQFDISVHQKL